ncbi:hypothetical protein [Granulosicoccus antarcticus]|uniref:DUF3108 domain-containing protein n=1 Tax=Granulosicoccus antarcticus IMCC3135 TaxID=1192854 RepID=A0A2Z2NLA9_9GAMM|nr:hypothetical protein [Granulosicoccus antarcticus]ASJ71939.1 hypothetical protein IMCC3135_09210 [Granulosicoccus antarcticus IMCC3135]
MVTDSTYAVAREILGGKLAIRSTYRLVALLITPLISPVAYAGSDLQWLGLDENLKEGVSFRYRVSDIESGVSLMDSRVKLSQRGLVAEQRLTETRIRFVYNVVQETAWLVDDNKRRFHEIPMVFSDSELTVQEHNVTEDAVESSDGLASLPDFQLLDGLPRSTFCEELAAAYRPSLRWQGRSLDTWECRDKNNDFVRLELFDKTQGVVVVSIAASGLVERWDELQAVSLDDEIFVPELDYISTSVNEFMSGRLEIGSYDAVDHEEQGGMHSRE